MKEISYLISHYIEAFIIFHYCHSIFKQKKSNFSVFLGFTLCYSILFGIFHFQNIYVNIIASVLAPLFLISYLYDVPKIYAFFHSLILYLSMALGELAGASLLSLLSDHYWNTWSTDIHLLFLSTILCKTLYLCIVFILICFQKKWPITTPISPDHGSFFLAAITFCSMFVSILLYIFGLQFPESSLSNCIIFITTVLLLVILFLVYALYNYNNKRNSDLLQLKLQLQKEQNLAEYNTALISQDTARRTLIHDIRNHLLSISILNQQKRYTELDQYIQALIHSEQLEPSIRICDNTLLNATLLRYQTFCHTKDIRFEVAIENHSIDFLSDTDLTALFCNLLDNAVTAADKVPSGWISLHVELFSPLHGILITMKNSCMDRPPQNFRHEWLTTKKESSTHGFGMKSIRRIADTYHGELQTAYLDHEHIFQTILTMYPQKEQVTHAHSDL